jgi:hypothetical protein
MKDSCAIFRGQHCNCDPDITFVDDAAWQPRTEKLNAVSVNGA